MPTVLRVGPYRFFFYSSDGGEHAHIHVERDECVAKFWLNLVRLSRSGGFRAKEIAAVAALVSENKDKLLEAWDAAFGD
ncbi:MAG: DUF4160 domain-containing protein [Rhodomicrobium sp.]